jgi:RNA polymerase primary sigma factor
MKSFTSIWRLYLKEIIAIPLLSLDEEKQTAVRARTGNKEALHKLIESNLRFVVKIARRFQKSGLPLLELISEGNIGLIEAARRFDPDRGVRFASYARWWIEERIFLYNAASAGIFRLPPRAANIRYRIGAALSRRINPETRIPCNQEFADQIGVSLKQLKTVIGASPQSYSLDHPLSEQSDTILSDELAQNIIPSPECFAVLNFLSEQLQESLQMLTDVEQRIIRLRFGLDDTNPLTLAKIGEHFNLSRERIRQIEKEALLKMRQSSISLATYLR